MNLRARRNGGISLASAVVLPWALGWAAGCGEVEPNWQRTGQTAALPRPGPDSRRPGPRADQQASAATRPAPAPRPAARTRPADTAPQPGDYFQLVLFSEPPPPETPRNFLHVRLERGSAAAVGEALGRLYLPVGMHGRDRFLLIYGTQAEWKAAAEFVRLLDVATAEELTDPPAPDPAEAFRRTVATMMARDRLGAVDRPGLAKVAAAFQRIAGSAAAPPPLRWASAMFAGDLYARSVYDYPRAEQLYVAAAGLAPDGSIEQMNALYARARTDLANGRKDRAEPLFATVVSQFTAYRQSEVYHRCRRGLGMGRE